MGRLGQAWFVQSAIARLRRGKCASGDGVLQKKHAGVVAGRGGRDVGGVVHAGDKTEGPGLVRHMERAQVTLLPKQQVWEGLKVVWPNTLAMITKKVFADMLLHLLSQCIEPRVEWTLFFRAGS